jgi:hypothetical protein
MGDEEEREEERLRVEDSGEKKEFSFIKIHIKITAIQRKEEK